jgi:hypothetical protein
MLLVVLAVVLIPVILVAFVFRTVDVVRPQGGQATFRA